MTDGRPADVRPAPPPPPAMAWGSDPIAAMLRAQGLEFVALNPGASYRGLHDSLVNLLGDERPRMVVCLHEEHAVAVAHGYAKVTGRPMAVALHSNVGLMHASMAIFNAYCDRVPMLLLGATGPVDASARRPWIDWIHTAADQGALIRGYCKWDDQPASVTAALESLLRADLLTRTYPCAPTYVCLDAALQEAPLEAPVDLPDPSRHRPAPPPEPPAGSVARSARALQAAERPLILVGRTGRDERSWAERVALAERLGACVLTDLKVAAAFPSRHRLNPVPPATLPSAGALRLVREADVILGLDWVDLGGTLRQAFGAERVGAHVISCTADAVLHNGWSKDHFALPPVDEAIAAHPDALVRALLARVGPAPPRPGWPPPAIAAADDPGDVVDGIPIRRLAEGLRRAVDGRRISLVKLPLGWSGADLDVRHPLDYLGQEGGGGIGAGPGLAVGAALALRGSGRLPVAVLGDGDLLMGASALWTAAHHRLPLLVVVANNRSYFNDELHQERIARQRGRPVQNRWVGQHIRDPAPDLARLAGSLGVEGHGPVVDPDRLDATLARAVAAAAEGAPVLVDVHVGVPPAGR